MVYNEYSQYFKDLNTKRFKAMGNSDFDYRISERSFSGRLTKARYKALNRICRANTWHSHCSHDWDCCGCKCAQSMSLKYKYNLVTIIITESFNY